MSNRNIGTYVCFSLDTTYIFSYYFPLLLFDAAWLREAIWAFRYDVPAVRVGRSKGGIPDEREKKFWFHVDEEMLSIAEESASYAVLKRCTADGRCLDHAPRVLISGKGVSGSEGSLCDVFRPFQPSRADAPTSYHRTDMK